MPSFSAFASFPGDGLLRAMTKSVALSCAEAGYNIRVNSVHPGLIHTELTDKEAKELGITFGQYNKLFTEATPLGHIGQPIDIAYASLYLASDESKWVTGAEYVVDGGYVAR